MPSMARMSGTTPTVRCATKPTSLGIMLKLYSYVIARDFGFAPNPFYGFCTLATCKPRIRTRPPSATGSSVQARRNRAARAPGLCDARDRDATFEEYWKDQRFVHKRPNLRGSLKQWFGDNIYHRNPRTGHWVQENSHHSRATGKPYKGNIDHDTRLTAY